MPESLPPPEDVRAVAFCYFGVLAPPAVSLGEAALAAVQQRPSAGGLAPAPAGQDWAQLLPVAGYALDQRVDHALDHGCHPEPAATVVYETLLEACGEAPSSATVAGVMDIFGEIEAQPLAPGAVAVLEELRASGLYVGVIANCIMPGRYLRTRMTDAGLDGVTDAVLLASEWGWWMPHPSPFRELVERLECAPEQTLLVCGDWRTAVQGGEAVGLRTVWLRRDLPERVQQVEHSYVVRELGVLLDWFAGDR